MNVRLGLSVSFLVAVACGTESDPALPGGASGSSGTSASSGGTPPTPDADSDASLARDAAADAPTAPTCSLTASGPIVVTADDQVIENVDIETDGSAPGITIEEHARVVVRNVRIRHHGGAGIALVLAPDAVLENVVVENTGAPVSGENVSDEWINVVGYESPRLRATHLRLTRGSSGIYLVESPGSVLGQIEGHDFRGPFPRGQLVQWDKSGDALLEDFSVENPAGSWPEDNVNVYQSTNVTVRRGVVDGNNSPSGVGVIFDGESSTGVVEDVDALHMGNGCFSNIAGVDGNRFVRTRCRDNVCGDQGRGLPLSNALMWAGNEAHVADRIEDSVYFAACNADNIVWPDESFAAIGLTLADFVPRAPLRLGFCWE